VGPGAAHTRPGGQRPEGTRRRPKPKVLTEAPALMTGGAGESLAATLAERGAAPPQRRPGGATGMTDDEGKLTDPDPDAKLTAVAGAVRATAREIAARLAVQAPRERRPRRSGSGELMSAPYRGGGGDVDLERTLAAVAERRPLRPEDILVRERRRRRRAVVLAVDVSGSMRGERLRTAAAAVGALTAELVRDDLAVVAFWSDAAALVRFGERPTLEQVVDGLLVLDAVGLTNVSFPLEFAAQELRAAGERVQQVLLLSDCVHNAGPDPRAIAAQLPRLDVLFDVSGEKDEELARDLARLGRGIVAPIRDHRDVAPALTRALGS
jgi:Mg-chelatase subunit ChlD